MALRKVITFRVPSFSHSTTFTRLCSSSSKSGESTPSAELPGTSASQATQQKDLFDIETVEKLIVDSSKDMPVDMTNPFERDRMQCIMCRYKVELDYKNVKLLSQFVSSFTGNVYDRHITRLCSEQQDRLVRTIRLSRNTYFMPKLFKNVEFLKDPKLFDPNNPIKPHPF